SGDRVGYYQKVQFAQLVLSLSLVMLAFALGLFAGWRRWGRSSRDEGGTARTGRRPSAATTAGRPAARPTTVATLSRRPDLFSPELDLSEPDLPLIRGEHTAGS
ncbi:MAG: hypothetical protein ACK4V6_12185, partial [Microthrixaceae bacterium]